MFLSQFTEQLKTGKRARRTQYTRLDANLVDGCVSSRFSKHSSKEQLVRKILKIQDINEDLLALLVANMPDPLRRELIDAIDSIYKDCFTIIDTQKAGPRHTFDSIHFSYYNRYSKRVSQFFLF